MVAILGVHWNREILGHIVSISMGSTFKVVFFGGENQRARYGMHFSFSCNIFYLWVSKYLKRLKFEKVLLHFHFCIHVYAGKKSLIRLSAIKE